MQHVSFLEGRKIEMVSSPGSQLGFCCGCFNNDVVSFVSAVKTICGSWQLSISPLPPPGALLSTLVCVLDCTHQLMPLMGLIRFVIRRSA